MNDDDGFRTDRTYSTPVYRHGFYVKSHRWYYDECGSPVPLDDDGPGFDDDDEDE
jgi:hypothetical protein